MPALPGSAENVTGRAELAVAVTLYVGPPTTAVPGGDDVKLIVCEAAPIANDCWTWGAARKLPLPAWFALIVHVPAPTSETVAPDTVHTPALPAAAEKTTARPELAVAVAV